MAVLAVAVVLVAVLCLLDLLMTLGVIRRLREHTAHLDKLLRARTDDGLPPIGTVVGEFNATAVDGTPVSRESAVDRMVAFFSPGCEPCLEKLPGFAEYASAWADGPRRVLAVVKGSAEEANAMVDLLARVAIVVVEGADAPVSRALGVDATPVFCVVDRAGAVIAADYDFKGMPTPVEA